MLALRGGGIEVLATDLRDPVGVAIATDGSCLVAEAAAGRVVRVNRSKIETVIADLQRPQGILVRNSVLYIVDAGAKELIAFDLDTKVGTPSRPGYRSAPPPGVVPKPLQGMPPFSGPQGPFAGIASAADGTLYISADGDGSILALRRSQDGRDVRSHLERTPLPTDRAHAA